MEYVVSAGGGTVSPGRLRMGGQGLACAAWTLGTVAGEQAVEVKLVGHSLTPLVFTARARVGPAAEPVSCYLFGFPPSVPHHPQRGWTSVPADPGP